MPNVEHSFVLYALLLEPGGCLRAHITLFELVEPEEKKRFLTTFWIVTQHRVASVRGAPRDTEAPQWFSFDVMPFVLCRGSRTRNSTERGWRTATKLNVLISAHYGDPEKVGVM